MASSIQLLRSTNAQERPFAGNLLEGQPAININPSEPGLFFKATDGSVVKIGPAAITSDGSPPNSSPTGASGNAAGELWLDKSMDPAVLKVYDGTTWIDAGSGGGGSSGVVTLQRWVKTAVGGETSLSGPDNSAQILSYTPGLEEVFLNGVLLTRDVDYFASSGTSITSLSPLTSGDEITVLGWSPFEALGPINGANLIDDSVVSSKIAELTSDKVSYVRTSVGANIRSGLEKLEDWVSVLDFIPQSERAAIIAGTSTFNCSPAVQAAIDSSKGGIFFPPGFYNLEDVIYLPIYNWYGPSINGGYTIFGQGATLVVKTTDPLFTTTGSINPTLNDDFTSRWRFNNLSYVGGVSGAKIFDLDRIYNTVFSHNSFYGVGGCVFYSGASKPGHSNGYSQSVVIAHNHFSSCKGLVAKVVYNLTVDSNFFEGCSGCVYVDSPNDTACNGIRITNNVMESAGFKPVILGNVFGGVISGNYFENNPFIDAELDLDVPGAAPHRGLFVCGNQFRPTSAQKADPNYACIKIGNKLKDRSAPVILCNVTTGGKLLSGITKNSLVMGNQNIGDGTEMLDYVFPTQTYTLFGGIGEDSTLENRSTAYDAGTATWKVFKTKLIDRSAIYEADGFLNISNIGLSRLGRTVFSMKFWVNKDDVGNYTAGLIDSLYLDELSGTTSFATSYYTNYWGSVIPSFSISGGWVTVSFDSFNDYNYPSAGTVRSIRPDVSVRILGGGGDYADPAVSTDF